VRVEGCKISRTIGSGRPRGIRGGWWIARRSIRDRASGPWGDLRRQAPNPRRQDGAKRSEDCDQEEERDTEKDKDSFAPDEYGPSSRWSRWFGLANEIDVNFFLQVRGSGAGGRVPVEFQCQTV